MTILKQLIIASLFIIFNSYTLSSQTQIELSTFYTSSAKKNIITKNLRIGTDKKHTVSGTFGFFDPWIGVSYERLILPNWGFDASIGLIGASIGTKYYYPKISDGKVSFLIGFSEGILLLVGAKHYIPVGFTYLGNNGFRLSLDLGPQIYHDSKEELDFGFSLKLGKTF